MSFHLNAQFSGVKTNQESQISGVGTITTGQWDGSPIDDDFIDLEGTSVLSTGEVTTLKFLRADGDGSSSWQLPTHEHEIEGVNVLSTGEPITKFLRANI